MIIGGIGGPGAVRAFDVRTGLRRWIFHLIPRPGEFGYDTWPPEAYKIATGVMPTNIRSNKLTLTLSLPTGVFRGTFLDTGVVRTVNFAGALLQKSTNASGYFLGTNLSGQVVIQSR